MRKFLNEATKTLTVTASGLTFYAFYLQKQDQIKMEKFNKVIQETEQQHTILLDQYKKMESLINKLENSTDLKIQIYLENYKSNTNNILALQNNINEIEKQLLDLKDLSNTELISNLVEEQASKLLELKNLYTTQNLDLSHFYNYAQNLSYSQTDLSSITVPSSDIITQNSSAIETVTKASGTIQKQIKNLIENNDQQNFQSFFDTYREFLASLSLEQLACLGNAIGLIAVLLSLISITLGLFGSYIVDSLNLESRFPKLAQIIKLRQKVTKFYIIYNVIFLYAVVLALIFVNLFLVFT